MGIKKDSVFKEFKPKLPDWLSAEEREEINEQIGEYLLSEVLDFTGQGISPVTGKSFATLDKEYAEEQKGGNKTANLDLNGDMMGAMSFDFSSSSIKVGIMDDPDQAIKAYGHITGFEGHKYLDGKVPKRKLIPSEKENFAPSIMEGVKELIEDYLADVREDQKEA